MKVGLHIYGTIVVISTQNTVNFRLTLESDVDLQAPHDEGHDNLESYKMKIIKNKILRKILFLRNISFCSALHTELTL